jgi:hypothetical protein
MCWWWCWPLCRCPLLRSSCRRAGGLQGPLAVTCRLPVCPWSQPSRPSRSCLSSFRPEPEDQKCSSAAATKPCMVKQRQHMRNERVSATGAAGYRVRENVQHMDWDVEGKGLLNCRRARAGGGASAGFAGSMCVNEAACPCLPASWRCDRPTARPTCEVLRPTVPLPLPAALLPSPSS